MSVQVIMKGGRPEWAVIPYAEYEALLARAGSSAQTAESVVAPVTEPSTQSSKSSFFAGMKSEPSTGASFSAAKFSAIKTELGKSSSTIAKDAGISPAYCDQIERGEREPSPAIIRGLAQALKIKPDELLG